MDKKNLCLPQGFTIFDGDGNLACRWYLAYYENGTRKRIYLNVGKSASERYALAQKKINEILGKENEIAKAHFLSDLEEKLNTHLEEVKTTNRERTWFSYKSKLGIFLDWCKKENIATLGEKEGEAFSNYLRHTRKLKNATYNCYLNLIVPFLNKYYGIKPFKVRRLKKDSQPYKYFTKRELNELKEAIQPQHPILWLTCQLTFFGLLREKEIRFLQIKHIDLEENKIILPSEISKTKEERYIPVIPQLKEILEEWQLHKYPSNFYLIGKEGKPSKEIIPRDWIILNFRPYLNDLGFDMQRYGHYSLKNTGIKTMLEMGTPLKIVSRIAGHTTTWQTEQYVRQWNLDIDDVSKIRNIVI